MFCVTDTKEKFVTFCFLKIKAKEKANIFKIIGGRVNDVSMENLGLSSFKVNV